MGAPFFSGGEADGDGVGVSVGAELGDGVSSGVAEGEGVSVGVGVGEDFFFFDFDFALGVALGSGVGEDFFFFFFGVADGDGVGDGVGLFLATECLRCFRAGVGVGVAKNFLIFWPNDSSTPSAGAPAAKPINKNRKTRSDVFKPTGVRIRRLIPAGWPYSYACRLRDSPAGSSR